MKRIVTILTLCLFLAPITAISRDGIDEVGYDRSKFSNKVLDGVAAVTDQLNKKFPAAHFPETERLVVRILTKLVSSDLYKQNTYGTPNISVRVVHDRMVNAMAAGDGRIYVFAGIMQVLKSEDELAAVLAHELAHVTRAHQERMIDWMDQRGIDMSGSTPKIPNMQSMMDMMLKFPGFKREMEWEADEAGLMLHNAAGYKPASMARAFTSLLGYQAVMKAKQDAAKKKKAKTGGQPKNPFGDGVFGDIIKKMFASHPPLAERIGHVYAQANKRGYTTDDPGMMLSDQYKKAKEEVDRYFNAKEKPIIPSPFPTYLGFYFNN